MDSFSTSVATGPGQLAFAKSVTEFLFLLAAIDPRFFLSQHMAHHTVLEGLEILGVHGLVIVA